MSFIAEQIPFAELHLRHEKCRQLLKEYLPHAQGLLVFSRTNIYYLSGSRANGMFWLPIEGEPVLLVRKGEDRCRLESSLPHMATFKSYSNIPDICASFGSPLGSCLAAEMRALPWSLAQMLQDRLKNIEFVAGDRVFNQARFIKTPYELDILRRADALHAKGLACLTSDVAHEKNENIYEYMPEKLRLGMSERDIAHTIWRNLFVQGHGGMLRMNDLSQEIFLGKISIGKNSLIPAAYQGGIGLMGEHPCMPFMGYAGSIWNEGQILLVDTGFILEGYHSASCQTYFGGSSQNIPQVVQNAQACCFEILEKIDSHINEQQSFEFAWNMAESIAKKYGFSDGFMGLTDNKSMALGQSIGLALDGRAVLAPNLEPEQCLLPAKAVFSVGPMIALPDYGVVAIKHSFEVQEDMSVKAFAGLEQKQNIICVP